jgi:hypothetical protein
MYEVIEDLRLEHAAQKSRRSSLNWQRAARQFILFTAGGALFGVAVGFFVFLRLGFPSQAALSGYLSGLFVVAGCKVGLLTWFGHILISCKKSSTRNSVEPAESGGDPIPPASHRPPPAFSLKAFLDGNN